MNTKAFFRSAALSLAALTALPAQEAVTDPVGFVTTTCLSGSDTHVSVPLIRTPAFKGAVSSVENSTVTVAGNVNWQSNIWSDSIPHYFKVLDGPRSGAWFPIVGNGTNSLNLDLGLDSLSQIGSAMFAIVPFTKLGDIFPVGNTTIHQSGGTGTLQRRTQVLIPNSSGTGTNLNVEGVYYLTSQGWRTALQIQGPPFVAANALADPYLRPDSYFIIRHRTQDATTTYTCTGSVDYWPVQTILTTLPSSQSDHPLSNQRPVPVKLTDLDLISSGAFLPSNGSGSLARRDQLIVYNNGIAGVNKNPSAIYYYNSQNPARWVDSLDPNRDTSNDEIPAGAGFIIRKFRTTTNNPAVVFWKHDLASGN